MQCAGKRTTGEYSYKCTVPTKWEVSISDKYLSKYQSCERGFAFKPMSLRVPERVHSNAILTTGRHTRQAQRERPFDVPAPSDCTDNPVGSIRVGEAVFLLFRQPPGCGQRSLPWKNYKRREHSGKTLHKALWYDTTIWHVAACPCAIKSDVSKWEGRGPIPG